MSSSRVAVVTDSTAALPAGGAGGRAVVTFDGVRLDLLGAAAGGSVVGHAAVDAVGPGLTGIVPLHVVLGDDTYREGVDLTTNELVARIVAGDRAGTTQPSPQAFADAYRAAADAGAREIVSVHLSGALSGTVDAARLAARSAPVRVHVVDSRTAGAALGLAVRAARRTLDDGGDAAEAVRVATAVCASSATAFLVESLEHLRRGGRLGRAASTIGTILGVRPILELREGRIEVGHMARGRRSAESRLESLVIARAESLMDARLAVHYFDERDAADALATRLTEQTGLAVDVLEVSAVLGAHVGPGLLGAVVADGGGGRAD